MNIISFFFGAIGVAGIIRYMKMQGVFGGTSETADSGGGQKDKLKQFLTPNDVIDCTFYMNINTIADLIYEGRKENWMPDFGYDFGTNEEVIFEAFRKIGDNQNLAGCVAKKFKEEYGKDLYLFLTEELSDEEMAQIKKITSTI